MKYNSLSAQKRSRTFRCFAKNINASQIAAARAANADATVAQLKAIFGRTSDAMPTLYTKSADRKHLAIKAMQKLQKGA